MLEFVSNFEEWLPHWLGKAELQWMVWIYAVWQIVRCNRITLLLLSIFPFHIAQRRAKQTVVVLGAIKDYDMSVDDMRAYFRNHSLRNLEIIHPENKQSMCISVKHCGYYYITHEQCMCQLAECSRRFGENVIFVERILAVTGSLAVGRKLSETEAYERIFSKRSYCGRGAYYVVPTFLNYVDLNSSFWGVLTIIPILLQATNFNRVSNLLSLTIIVLDLNRNWLYNIYDYLFDRVVEFVKIGVFKERTGLYNFFSIFSSRWGYSDCVKKCCYVASRGEKVKIRSYSKLKSLEDLVIDCLHGYSYGPNDQRTCVETEEWEQYGHDPNKQDICMEIVKDRAYCKPLEFGEFYAQATLRRPVYVF